MRARSPLVLSAGERDQLAEWAAQAGRRRLAVRAAIVLAAAEGAPDAAVAARAGVARGTAAKWRGEAAAPFGGRGPGYPHPVGDGRVRAAFRGG